MPRKPTVHARRSPESRTRSKTFRLEETSNPTSLDRPRHKTRLLRTGRGKKGTRQQGRNRAITGPLLGLLPGLRFGETGVTSARWPRGVLDVCRCCDQSELSASSLRVSERSSVGWARDCQRHQRIQSFQGLPVAMVAQLSETVAEDHKQQEILTSSKSGGKDLQISGFQTPWVLFRVYRGTCERYVARTILFLFEIQTQLRPTPPTFPPPQPFAPLFWLAPSRGTRATSSFSSVCLSSFSSLFFSTL